MTDQPAYVTRLDANLMLMREINRLRFLDWFKPYAPLVRKELERHGVKFPKH